MDGPAKAIADRALGDYADLLARMGRVERLETLLGETDKRNINGSAAERVGNAREALAVMRTDPQSAFRCGPLALDRVLASMRPSYRTPKALADFASTARGTSLAQIANLAMAAGEPMAMAKRNAKAGLVLPAVMHWKSGHFAAVVREADGRYLVEDPILGHQAWLSRGALEGEISGYALVATNSLPDGWRRVSAAEGARVWGGGGTTVNNPQNFKPCDPRTGCNGGMCSPPGMAAYDFHLMLVNLNITDEPVGYDPPIGPAVRFRATYNQRESYQPQTFSYMNLGPKWTFDWLSYIEDSSTLSAPVNLYVRGGGQETYDGYDPTTETYAPHKESRATVRRVTSSPIKYERLLPDGAIEVFEQVHGTFPSRKVFMTKSIDPHGNAITLNYGSSPSGGLRLVSITDRVGQVTTLSYDLPGDDLKITRVTDPFVRSASFAYANGRLDKITDVIGMESSFEYGTSDFITKLITPYGATNFSTGILGTDGQQMRDRWLQAVDPLGGTERLVYFPNLGQPHNTPYSDPTAPPEFTNQNLWYRNTFYWDKRAMAAMPPGTYDYTKARIYHWLHRVGGPMNSGILESVKAPLESRVWYGYEGQGIPPIGDTMWEGTHAQPNRIARRMDDGSVQLRQFKRNLKGKVCEAIDPMGRRTRYTYGTLNVPDSVCATGSSLDLLKVEQEIGAGMWDVVQTTSYNAMHQPLMITDASGETTEYTYLPDGTGRLGTVVTPPRAGHDGQQLSAPERTTLYEYYPSTDAVSPYRLKKVMGPNVGADPGPSTTFTYDLKGRLKTTTDTDNYTLTMDYDDLDRLTQTTYPDGTFDLTIYNRLDAEVQQDRQLRRTFTYHDALRRPWQIVDPLSRTTTLDWCTCGNLDAITDGEGNKTEWDRDLMGRVETETRADDEAWTFQYENRTSRLKSVNDPKLQVKTFTYALDDRVTGITYTNEVVPTPDVTFGYLFVGQPDPHGRLLTMTDGTGMTTYHYHPAGGPGALRLASVSVAGTGTQDVIEYGYDEMGRVKSRKLNTAANEVGFLFDSLGRLRTQVTPAGSFVFAYEGVTDRRSTLTYPNGAIVEYGYHPNPADRRLAEIHNKAAGGATLSRFGYTYDDVGTVDTWSQQRGSGGIETYDFTYDAADQMIDATPLGPGLPSYADTYDNVGNRLTHADEGGSHTGSYNDRNAISLYGPDGLPPVPFTHDANGNMTSNGSQSYTWDAENRLVSVMQGPTTLASFVYDGMGRRLRKTAGSVTTTYIHDGATVIEQRSGAVATKLFDGPGIDEHLASQRSSSFKSYYTSDHLGSVTDVMSPGIGGSSSRKYDPWGNLIGGDFVRGGYGFTGREWDAETGLYYYRARYYDPKIGRFISEDPIGFVAGVNFYSYVLNNPVRYTDPSGLETVQNAWGQPGWTGFPTPPTPPQPPPPDFCGSIGTEWVPDRPMGTDFRSACVVHDACYEKCSTFTRGDCDGVFYRSVQSTCGGQSVCRAVGNFYTLNIIAFGRGAFRRSRRE